ncbi:MAG: trehalose-phosphatase [Dehalococcoidales bacterium]|nr:trehalose-phosphatase [Dehalococcoidales bacterium]
MKHLFKSWQAFRDDFHTLSHVLFLSDYDGTLTPIVGRPRDAVLSPAVREKLTALAQRPDFTVGIISGRSLVETRYMAAIEGIYYAGNHGLEIEGPGLDYVSTDAELGQAMIKDLVGQLEEELENIDGVIVEDKGLSLSVHYRLVSEEEQDDVAVIFKRIVSSLADAGKIKITSGKKVFEVRPPIDWDKGKAIESIRREILAFLKLENVLTVYLGDDTTDEDAFKVLKRPLGWSVYVGGENNASAAEYYLNSTEEVEQFLSRLLELK